MLKKYNSRRSYRDLHLQFASVHIDPIFFDTWSLAWQCLEGQASMGSHSHAKEWHAVTMENMCLSLRYQQIM